MSMKPAFALLAALAATTLLCGQDGGDRDVGDILLWRDTEIKKLQDTYEAALKSVDSASKEKLGALTKRRMMEKNTEGARSAQAALEKLSGRDGDTPGPQPASSSPQKQRNQPPEKRPDAFSFAPQNFEDGSFSFKGHRYYMFPNSMNYYDAINACQTLGGHLPSIDSEDEYKLFHSIASKNAKPVWLDLKKLERGCWLNWKNEPPRLLKMDADERDSGDMTKDRVILNMDKKGSNMTPANGSENIAMVICEIEN